MMAGTINLSLSQQFDAEGVPLSGGLLYFFQAGTTTPQSAYQDQALTIAYPNPIELDASGRVPPFFLADGNIKIRLATSTGVTVIAADNLLVIGPSSGGGGGGTVDPTTVLATGDIKARYGTGALAGFVRLNGRTVGSATSGANERANADCQALFEYLWTTNSGLTVSGGRGATANADWLANKTITIPDMRGRVMAGMDDMGGTQAGRLTASFFGNNGTALGAVGGAESSTLTSSTQLPSHTHSVGGNTGTESATHGHTYSGTTSGQSADHTHASGEVGGPTGTNGAGTVVGTVQSTTGGSSNDHTHTYSGTTNNESATHFHTFSVTSGATGASAAFRTMPNAMVLTFYQKL